ncbi:MAG: hypothetical protein AAGA03_01590 [Planctomycetota bacterium]
MPSSRPVAIPYVVDIVRQVTPNSILDVGVGFGKYGHLFREYTDIVASERQPERYERTHWQCRIDGVEVFQNYLTPMHEYLYDHVYIGEANGVVTQIPDATYDMVWMGDVIEHFDKQVGIQVIQQAKRIAKKVVVLATPNRFVPQDALVENEHERHLSYWTKKDFEALGSCRVADLADDVRIAVMAIDGQPLPAISIRHATVKLRLYRWWKRLCSRKEYP